MAGPDLNIAGSNEVTPCALLLDLSDSMKDPVGRSQQSRIDALNEGLQTLRVALAANLEAKRRVEIALLSVGGVGTPTDVTLIHDFLRVQDFHPPQFAADGETPLGQGILMALDTLEKRLKMHNKRAQGVTRPWLFILSDGEPTDDDTWPVAVRRAQEAELRGRCLIVPFLIEGGEAPRLHDLVDGPVPTLLLSHFPQFFKWVSRRVSTPVGGRNVGGAARAPRGVDMIAEWQTVQQQPMARR